MTPEQIQATYARAKAVVDGTKRPSEQNARDVINILKHYSATKQPETLHHSANSANSANSAKPSAEMPDFFKGIFG
jgi:hypothetical protein